MQDPSSFSLKAGSPLQKLKQEPNFVLVSGKRFSYMGSENIPPPLTNLEVTEDYIKERLKIFLAKENIVTEDLSSTKDSRQEEDIFLGLSEDTDELSADLSSDETELQELITKALNVIGGLIERHPIQILKQAILDLTNYEIDPNSVSTIPTESNGSHVSDSGLDVLDYIHNNIVTKSGRRCDTSNLDYLESNAILLRIFELYNRSDEFRVMLAQKGESGANMLNAYNLRYQGVYIDQEEDYLYKELVKLISSINQFLKISYHLWRKLVPLDILNEGYTSNKARFYCPISKKYIIQTMIKCDEKKTTDYIALTQLQIILTLLKQNDPDLVKILAVDYQPGEYCSFQMESGIGTLADFYKFRLIEKLPWKKSELAILYNKLKECVDKLKNIGICHRDINPESIIITEGFTLKLIDFGMSEFFNGPGAKTMLINGTSGFYCPEIEMAVENNWLLCDIDPYAADLFSLEKVVKIADVFSIGDQGNASTVVTCDEFAFRKYTFERLYLRMAKQKPPEELAKITDLYGLPECEDWFKEQVLSTSTAKTTMVEKAWFLSFLGRIKYLKKEFSEALAYFTMLRQARAKILGEDHPSVAFFYHNIALVQNNLHNPKEAVICLEKALELRLKAYGEKDESVANSYNALGQFYFEQGDIDKAQQYFEKALLVASNVVAGCNKLLASYYRNLGMVFTTQNKFENALENFNQAIDFDAKQCSVHLSVAISHNLLASVYLAQGNPLTALNMYKKALQIMLTVLGEYHPDVAIAYDYIGALEHSLINRKEALMSYGHALAVGKKVFGRKHPFVCQVYFTLGIVCHEEKMYDEALLYFRRALQMKKEVYDRERNLISSQTDFDAYYDELAYSEAMYERRRSSSTDFTKLKTEIVLLYYNIGLVYHNIEKYKEACHYLYKSLSILKKTAAEENEGHAVCYSVYALSCYDMENYKDALKYYKKSAEVYTKIGMEINPSLATICENVGMMYDKGGEKQKSLDWFYRGLHIKRQLYGDDHPEVKKLEKLIDIIIREQNKI